MSNSTSNSDIAPALPPSLPTFSFKAALPARDQPPRPLQIQLDQIRAKLGVAEHRIGHLDDVVKEREEECDRLRQRVSKYEDAHNYNVATMDELVKENEALLKQLSAAVTKAENKEADYEYASKQLVDLQKELDGEKNKHAAVKESLEKVKRAATKREHYIADVEKNFEKVNAENEQLIKARERYEDDFKKERNATNVAKREKEAVSKEFAQFIEDQKNAAADRLTKDTETKKQELAAKDNEIANLKSDLAKSVTTHNDQVRGFQEEINQLKADVKLRMSTRPDYYQGLKPTKKVLALQNELETDITIEDDTADSSSSSSDSDDQKKDVSPVKKKIVVQEKIVYQDRPVYEDRIVYQDRIVEVPGPVITNTVEVSGPVVTNTVEVPGPPIINNVEVSVPVAVPGPVIVRDRVRVVYVFMRRFNALQAWFGAERDFLALVVQPTVAITAWALGIIFRSILRFETPIDENPIDDANNEPETANADQIHIRANVSVGNLTAAPDGPAPGTDPSDPIIEGVGINDSNPGVNLADFLPPIIEPDNRVRLEGENEDRMSRISSRGSDSSGSGYGGSMNGASGTGSGPIPAFAGVQSEEGFFDILNATRPPVRGTLFTMLIHVIVYYFIYVCYLTYFERKMWIEANDPARVATLELIRSHATSFWNILVGPRGTARADNVILLLVKLLGVDFKPYPLPG